MRLLVVIVNYQTPDLTIDCLRCLRDEIMTIPEARVAVVDNASPDQSASGIASAIASNGWSTWAELRILGQNRGFAAGNNGVLGAALQSPDPPQYVLLLNPDTLVRPGAVSALLAFMDANPNVGIAGSRLEDRDGSGQRSAFRFPTVLSELEGAVRMSLVSRLLRRAVVAPPVPQTACRVDWVAGASMIVRRAVFDAIGLLDESYFMYFEEVDFCLRASRADWPCWYVPQSRVVHLVGQSSGVTDLKRLKRRRPAYWFASRRRFFLTHYGRTQTLIADMLWAAGFSFWRIRRALFRIPDNDPSCLLGDFIRYNFLSRRHRPAAR